MGFFSIGEMPTGSRDPFAIRRSAIATIRLLETHNIRLSTKRLRAALMREQEFSLLSRWAELKVDLGLVEGKRAIQLSSDFAARFEKLKFDRAKYEDFRLELLEFVS